MSDGDNDFDYGYCFSTAYNRLSFIVGSASCHSGDQIRRFWGLLISPFRSLALVDLSLWRHVSNKNLE